jgi:hypothetical protein
MYESELVEGIIRRRPNLFSTKSDKLICKTKIETEDEILNVIAWEENAEILDDLKVLDKIIVKGYRKYNAFTKKEEFNITQFIKRRIN